MLAPLHRAVLAPLHRVRAPLCRRMGASATSLPSMASVTSAAPALGLFIAGAGLTAATVTYFVDTRVNKEVALVREEMAKLKAGADGLKVEVDAKCVGLASGVDAKCAGLASGVDAKCAGLALGLTKEVDAKNAGLTKELDAKNAGLTKELDAKNAGLVKEVEARMAGVVAIAASKAEAETLRVFKEYKVRAS